MESFITITAHFIDVDWKIKSCVLQTTNIGTTHTAENLANHLISIVVEDYEIPKEKICGVVHDNARNVMKMNEVLVEELECKSWQSISCAAHSLQLVVKAGLQVDAIQELVSSVRKLVGHFKHSTTAVSALQKEQVGMGIPQHKLKHDVATRWNSVLLMIERASEQRWAIAKVLGNSEITPKRQHRSLDLNQEQWELIQELVGILKPFEAATTLFCTEQQVSISCVYAVIVRMKSTLNSTDNEIPAIKKMKSQMKRKLEDLWNFNDIEKDCVSPLILSAALDPRFKTLQFLLPESIQKVKSRIVTMVQKEIQNHEEESLKEEPQRKKRKMEGSALDLLLGEEVVHVDDNRTGHLECESYWLDKGQPRDGDPLHWWSVKQSAFPTIATLAKKYLCIPATSAASERIFSRAADIQTDARNRLSGKTVDSLIFLSVNEWLLHDL